MKLLSIATSLLIALLLTSPTVFADGGDWSTDDTYRQIAVTALSVADWSQTRYMAKNPCAREGGGTACTDPFGEEGLARPFIGAHPSVGKVNSYFAISIIANTAINYMLPSEWRARLQYAEIVVEAGTVRRNYIGIKYGF
jgi:hypothetical protein